MVSPSSASVRPRVPPHLEVLRATGLLRRNPLALVAVLARGDRAADRRGEGGDGVLAEGLRVEGAGAGDEVLLTVPLDGDEVGFALDALHAGFEAVAGDAPVEHVAPAGVLPAPSDDPGAGQGLEVESGEVDRRRHGGTSLGARV